MRMDMYGLKKPFFALAPMANITTYPFASQAIKFGADLVWTPMVHTDTVINNWPEAEKILNFKKIPNYIVQLVGAKPENFSKAVGIILKHLTPTGIDLNFACPDKNIIKSGCGGVMMKESDSIIEIVKIVKGLTKLPVSVKTRCGWDDPNDIYPLTDKLIKAGIDLLIIHPRTVKQGFRGKADWDIITKLVKMHPGLPICGSGDVLGWRDAIEKQKITGCAGIMIGRGALGRPWIFREISDKNNYQPSLDEIKKLIIDLAIKASNIWGERGITESRKHFSWYFKGFPRAREYRKSLMLAKTLVDVRKILK